VVYWKGRDIRREAIVPRRKKDPDGAESAPESKPEGMTGEQWTLGKALGNVALAGDLLAVARGDRAPRDENEALQLLQTSGDLQRKALSRYVRVRDSIKPKLNHAYGEYVRHRERTAAIERTMHNLGAIVSDRSGINERGEGTAPAPTPGSHTTQSTGSA
jgi:hypothetical protein